MTDHKHTRGAGYVSGCLGCILISRQASWTRYGIDPETAQAVHDANDGTCDICGKRPRASLHLDHDHTTGKARGMLCNHCNRALGLMFDNPAALRAAADYLEAACAR